MPRKWAEKLSVPSAHCAVSEGLSGVTPAVQPQLPVVWAAQLCAGAAGAGGADRWVGAVAARWDAGATGAERAVWPAWVAGAVGTAVRCGAGAGLFEAAAPAVVAAGVGAAVLAGAAVDAAPVDCAAGCAAGSQPTPKATIAAMETTADMTPRRMASLP